MNDSTKPSQAADSGSTEPVTGKKLREARIAANIDVAKICNDLRLSVSVIEALETGNYHLLSGDPYIRALLGSVGRYLNLDVPSLIAGYSQDIGAVQASPSISPYKDREPTYTTAHKQIFVVVFLALFVGMIVLIGKINKGDSEAANQGAGMNPAPVESLTIPQDTGLESHSLAPDSDLVKIPAESGETPVLKESPEKAKPGLKPKPTPIVNPAELVPTSATVPVAPVAPAATLPTVAANPERPEAGKATTPTDPAPVAVATAPGLQTLAVIKPLIDSVSVKVLRTGKEDFSTVLRMGKQMQVSNQDTIVVFISKRKSVEVTIGENSVIPDKRRFKIYGTTLRTF